MPPPAAPAHSSQWPLVARRADREHGRATRRDVLGRDVAERVAERRRRVERGLRADTDPRALLALPARERPALRSRGGGSRRLDAREGDVRGRIGLLLELPLGARVGTFLRLHRRRGLRERREMRAQRGRQLAVAARLRSRRTPRGSRPRSPPPPLRAPPRGRRARVVVCVSSVPRSRIDVSHALDARACVPHSPSSSSRLSWSRSTISRLRLRPDRAAEATSRSRSSSDMRSRNRYDLVSPAKVQDSSMSRRQISTPVRRAISACGRRVRSGRVRNCSERVSTSARWSILSHASARALGSRVRHRRGRHVERSGCDDCVTVDSRRRRVTTSASPDRLRAARARADPRRRRRNRPAREPCGRMPAAAFLFRFAAIERCSADQVSRHDGGRRACAGARCVVRARMPAAAAARATASILRPQ